MAGCLCVLWRTQTHGDCPLLAITVLCFNGKFHSQINLCFPCHLLYVEGRVKKNCVQIVTFPLESIFGL